MATTRKVALNHLLKILPVVMLAVMRIIVLQMRTRMARIHVRRRREQIIRLKL